MSSTKTFIFFDFFRQTVQYGRNSPIFDKTLWISVHFFLSAHSEWNSSQVALRIPHSDPVEVQFRQDIFKRLVLRRRPFGRPSRLAVSCPRENPTSAYNSEARIIYTSFFDFQTWLVNFIDLAFLLVSFVDPYFWLVSFIGPYFWLVNLIDLEFWLVNFIDPDFWLVDLIDSYFWLVNFIGPYCWLVKFVTSGTPLDTISITQSKKRKTCFFDLWPGTNRQTNGF
jgi:hypothetical protein